MKFKLTSETKIWLGTTLYRVQALIDFGDVKSGEKGGFIEKEENLSQIGNAWVSGNAKVYGDALVYGNALVSGNAKVYGDALVYCDALVSGEAEVYNNAWVSGNAKVYGDALVYGNALVSGNAKVYGDALVYGDAWVYGDARLSPVSVSGLTYQVTILDDHMQIGGEYHSFDAWRGFDDRRIIQMGGMKAAKFWKDHGAILLALCDLQLSKQTGE